MELLVKHITHCHYKEMSTMSVNGLFNIRLSCLICLLGTFGRDLERNGGHDRYFTASS